MVPWGVPGGPWGVPSSPDALFSEFQGGSLGVPYANLVQFSSVQLFKTLQGPSLVPKVSFLQGKVHRHFCFGNRDRSRRIQVGRPGVPSNPY